MNDVDRFILESGATNSFFVNECLYEDDLFDCIPTIIKLSRSDDPIKSLEEYFSNDTTPLSLRLDNSKGGDEVTYLAFLVNACIDLNIEQFEEALASYTDFVVEQSIKQSTPPSNTNIEDIVRRSIDKFITSTPTMVVSPKPVVKSPIKSTAKPPPTKSSTTYKSRAKVPIAITEPIPSVESTTELPAKSTTYKSKAKIPKSIPAITEPEPNVCIQVHTPEPSTKLYNPKQRNKPTVVVNIPTEPPVQPITVSSDKPKSTLKRSTELSKKNNQLKLVAIASKIAAVRSIDTSALTCKFRSVESLKKSEFVKTVLSLNDDDEKLDYIASIFPKLKGHLDKDNYDTAIDKILDSSTSKSLRGLSSYILDYEVILKRIMIEQGVGHCAKILAIGQRTCSILDAPVVTKPLSPPKIKYKRQAILHEDIDILPLNTLISQVKICLRNNNKTRQTKGDILSGFITTRVGSIIKHIENVKTQRLVDIYNRDRNKVTVVYNNRRKYDKHMIKLTSATLACEYILSHCDIITKFGGDIDTTEAKVLLDSVPSIIEELDTRRHNVDMWAIGSTGRLLFHKEYLEFYNIYCTNITKLTQDLNTLSMTLTTSINESLRKLGSRSKLPPTIVKIPRKHIKSSLDQDDADIIHIKNHREGKRYITLYDEPIVDFTTSVSRQAELVKYNIGNKTDKQAIESMSELILSISTSREISGTELRSISQILLEISNRVSS
jgi:hypothetical protein